MLIGRIINDQVLLPITIGWKSNVQEIVVLIDTGFTGELKVSPEIATALGIEITAVRMLTMADGGQRPAGLALAFISLEGDQQEISVLIDKGLDILGMRALRQFGYTLTVDTAEQGFSLSKKEQDLFAT